jgi:hypothetical protein
MDLEAVATELYGLAPADFTNARDARASEAKRAGDRELARAIGKFKRPIVSAWLANVLVRERGNQVQSMIDLGAALRQAQARLAKDELRKLQRERRRAIAALLDDAEGLARDRGEGISSAVARDLEATLEAASLDPEAATALKAGLLTTGLRYAGLGWSDTNDGSSLWTETSEPTTAASPRDNSDAVLPPADQALRLAAVEARRDAEARLAEARRQVDEGKRHVAQETRDRDAWRRKVADLERQLDDARAEVQKAEHRVAGEEEALTLANQRLHDAQGRLDKSAD